MSRRTARSADASRVEIATRRAVMMRDAGLERISVVTRWLTAGVVALSGTLALVAAGGFPGHVPSTPATTASPSSSPSGLQPPSQALAQTPAAAVAVSGGS